MDLRGRLRFLIRFFLVGLVAVLLVGGITSALVLIRASQLANRSQPLQSGLTRLQQNIADASGHQIAAATAKTSGELDSQVQEAEQSLRQAEALIPPLVRLDPGLSATSVTALGQALPQIRSTTAAKLEALARLAEVNRTMQERLAVMQQACAELAKTMLQVRSTAQTNLETAQVNSGVAQARIRDLHLAREKLGEARGLILETRLIDNRWRLNTLKDRFKGALAPIRDQGAALLASDPALATMLNELEKAYLDETTGLLVLRAATIAETPESTAKEVFASALSALQSSFDSTTTHISEALDPQELVVVQTEQLTAAATATMAKVAKIRTASNLVSDAVHQLTTAAWRVLLAKDAAELTQLRAELRQCLDGAQQQFLAITAGLGEMGNIKDQPQVTSATAALPAVEQALFSDQGALAAATAALESQKRLDETTVSVKSSIVSIAEDTAARSETASRSQAGEVSSIALWSWVALGSLVIVVLAAITIGLTIGRRVTASILASEEQERLGTIRLRELLTTVTSSTRDLAQSSKQLTDTSQEVSALALKTSNQSVQSDSASARLTGVLSMVATSSEEMTASIGEISRNTAEAAKIAQEAVSLTTAAHKAMAQLGVASGEIGAITKLIAGLAEQTNLLALNATIEAARAGDAGRGFAVVASEVKSLAGQSSTASNDIAGRISSIQRSVDDAVVAIKRITEVTERISHIQASIASAVEEQTATTREMGQQISEASKDCQGIAAGIKVVTGAVDGTAKGAEQVRALARALLEMAERLEGMCKENDRRVIA